MQLSGYKVNVRLSRPGVTAVGNLLGSKSHGRTVRVLALGSDETGIWIENRRLEDGRIEVLLLKWQQIETVGFELRLTEPEARRPIGFATDRAGHANRES